MLFKPLFRVLDERQARTAGLRSKAHQLHESYEASLDKYQASLKEDIDYCFDATSCINGFWLEDEQFDLSARITWISKDEKWVGAVYGSNLTDEDYMIGGTALLESAGVGGYVVTAPRMYGAELKYSF